MSAVPAKRRIQIDRLLTAAVILFLLNIPFFYLYFKQISQTIAPRESVWRQIRIASSKANISGQGTLPIEPLILPFLTIIALIAVYEWADTGRRSLRTLCLVLLAGSLSITEWCALRSSPLADQLGGDSLAHRGVRLPGDCWGSWPWYFCWCSPRGRFPCTNMERMRRLRWLTIFLMLPKV